jgi:RsmE family RNA methyltransferase
MPDKKHVIQLVFLLQRWAPRHAFNLSPIYQPNHDVTGMGKSRLNTTLLHGLRGFFCRRASHPKHFHSSSLLRLNRFLFDPFEIDPQSVTAEESVPFVVLPRDDYRTEHAAKILGLENGDTLRAGIIHDHDNMLHCDAKKWGGYTTDVAQVEWLPEGKNKQPCPTKNGEPPGSLKIILHSLSSSPAIHTVRNDQDVKMEDLNHLHVQPAYSSPTPSVSLILALPRPLALSRLLPMISQLGVKDLILISAQKVPRDYFGSHLFRKPNELRRLLVEGLCQAGDVRIPHVRVVHRLKPFLEDGELDALFPLHSFARVIAHPFRSSDPYNSVDRRMNQVVFPKSSELSKPSVNIVLAVGPEGGWAEPYELDLFKSLGFQQITLGKRILRTDVAVVSLLSLAHDLCDQINSNREYSVNI